MYKAHLRETCNYSLLTKSITLYFFSQSCTVKRHVTPPSTNINKKQIWNTTKAAIFLTVIGEMHCGIVLVHYIGNPTESPNGDEWLCSLGRKDDRVSSHTLNG